MLANAALRLQKSPKTPPPKISNKLNDLQRAKNAKNTFSTASLGKYLIKILKMSPYIKLFFVFIAVLPYTAHSADYKKIVADAVANCPAKLKNGLPAFSPIQLEKTCGCIETTLENTLKDLNAVPTQQQMFEIGKNAAQRCSEPYAKEIAVQQCIASQETRHKFQITIGISNEQYDRYCGCHTNLVFDEIKRGLDPDNPKFHQTISQKSFDVCLVPIKANAK